jgi:flagellar hook protein FlgE
MQTAVVSAVGGIEQSLSKLNGVAGRISPGNAEDAVDLSSEAVSLIQAKDSFASNVAVLKVADQMEKSLFDLVG